ncbi:TonB-dependent receptor domain-containing protein [Pontibacter sp. G13]|uniref:TonB-dependent receptor domain-containing protein n=1 Tax=Pontibacter sp. G13 TaxID=3074898 RepID=UPI00288B1625|nr:TonB-dependent receptor [Pontibacter sp. G13]WNJ17806.1 TonB-dependent receptor [Pontibacter sp. G13]
MFQKLLGITLLILVPNLLIAQQTEPDTLATGVDADFPEAEPTPRNQIYTEYDIQGISQSGGNVNNILNRAPGAIVSGGFPIIRGLSARYNALFYDGIRLPNTEPTVKTFSLSLLPSGIYQQFDLYRTGAAEFTGEWGGAIIEVQSRNDVPQPFTQIAVSGGVLAGTTGCRFGEANDVGGVEDFFGWGADQRDWTKLIASTDEIKNMSRDRSAEEGAKLPNTWAPSERTGGPNYGLSFAIGRNIKIGRANLSTFNSLSFGKADAHFNFNSARYTNYQREDPNNPNSPVISSSIESFAQFDHRYYQRTVWHLMSNWKFTDGSGKNTFIFNNLYFNNFYHLYINKLSDFVRQNSQFWAQAIDLEQRQLFLNRIGGNHRITPRSIIDWKFGYAYYQSLQPDRRLSVARRFPISDLPPDPDDPESIFLIQIPRGSVADAGARFNGRLYENLYTHRLDFTQLFPVSFSPFPIQLRAGYYLEYNERAFNARINTAVQDDQTAIPLRFQPAQNIGTYLQPENWGPEGYFFNEGTQSNDQYGGESTLYAGYIQADLAIGRQWMLGAGFRYERFDQELNSDTINVDNISDSYLPFVNATWNISDSLALKFGFSQTAGRPSFRELAPFQFFVFEFGLPFRGNPELVNSQILNIDLGMEWTYRGSNNFLLSAFYKNIQDPIERALILQSDGLLFTFTNAQAANLAGIEFTYRKKFPKAPVEFFKRSGVIFNAAYIWSRIELGETTVEAAENRPLQGQSPYTISLVLNHVVPKTQWSFEVVFYTFGQNIFTVGDGQESYPWYNMPQYQLNASIGKKLGPIGLKFSVGNILNTHVRIKEDGNLDGKLNNDAVDRIVQDGFTGQNYTLGIGWNF